MSHELKHALFVQITDSIMSKMTIDEFIALDNRENVIQFLKDEYADNLEKYNDFLHTDRGGNLIDLWVCTLLNRYKYTISLSATNK